MNASTDGARSWLATPTHTAWLDDQTRRLLRFALGSALPAGGFAYQDADGSALPGRTPQLFLTARMAHASAIGVALGVPGAGALLDHAMSSLTGLFADPEHGGWFSDPAHPDARKAVYDHVHVGLAAASACAAGHPAGPELLAQAVDVIDTRLWDEQAQALRESFARDWSDDEPYRGANANMHGLEAFLAIGDVTGDDRWHRRGLAMATRVVREHASGNGWLMPEHFDTAWRALPDYNRDEPNHPFRPYGATYGHSLEWALPPRAARLARRTAAARRGLVGRRGLPPGRHGARTGLGGGRTGGARLHRRLGRHAGVAAAAALADHRGHPGVRCAPARDG